MKNDGHVMEIFSAIQGEGPWVGIRQVFFRLFRCNLRCVWCDTPDSFSLSGKGKVENPPGSRQFLEFENPITAEKAMELLDPFLQSPCHSISFTGGEPLMQIDFLCKLFPRLKLQGQKIFLETGGTLPELLEKVISFVDFISMDLKLPSSTLEPPFWDQHKEFLRLASKKETYVKIVLTETTLDDDIESALHLIRRTAPEIPLILQPVTRTPFSDCSPPSELQMLRWHTQALQVLPQTRVIPQVHKLMGQM